LGGDEFSELSALFSSQRNSSCLVTTAIGGNTLTVVSVILPIELPQQFLRLNYSVLSFIRR
jgi:hypothetical protein